ncbi:MAG: hypothetical protein QOD69_113, partial [Solirubrobacteraceae bacterium]|nr:hypothetical protein [Solirubrobacteraceae bacterium]
MIGTDLPPQGRSIALTLRVALLGLTILLAVIGALGIAALYDARQQYEDRLAAASALEVSSANLLAASVALEANLASDRTRAAARSVRAAASAVRSRGEETRKLAAEDGPSR